MTDRLSEIEAVLERADKHWWACEKYSNRHEHEANELIEALKEAVAIARAARAEAKEQRERAERAEADYKSSAQSAIDLGSYWEMRAAKLRGQRDEARAEAEALRAAKDEIAQQLDETTLERDELRSEAWNLRMERNALQQHVESGHGCRHSPEVFTRVRATLAGTAKAEQTHDDRGEPSPDERRTAAERPAPKCECKAAFCCGCCHCNKPAPSPPSCKCTKRTWHRKQDWEAHAARVGCELHKPPPPPPEDCDGMPTEADCGCQRWTVPGPVGYGYRVITMIWHNSKCSNRNRPACPQRGRD